MMDGERFDFAAVLATVAHRQASDLHLTAGAPPMIRDKGRIQAIEGSQNSLRSRPAMSSSGSSPRISASGSRPRGNSTSRTRFRM
jgi:Tfp pilus assembly ATPase PilU